MFAEALVYALCVSVLTLLYIVGRKTPRGLTPMRTLDSSDIAKSHRRPR